MKTLFSLLLPCLSITAFGQVSFASVEPASIAAKGEKRYFIIGKLGVLGNYLE